MVEAESNDTEEKGENDEATELDRFATKRIDSCNRDPITRYKASTGEDKIAYTSVVQSDVSLLRSHMFSYF